MLEFVSDRRTASGDIGHPPVSNLAELVRLRGATDRDRIGFTFLTYASGDEPVAEDLTYGQLLRRAEAIAATLQQNCRAGDRVLILCPPGLDYIAAFFACQLGGLVAVPAYPPRNVRHLGRLVAILTDAGAKAILATANLIDQMAGWVGDLQALPPIVAVDRIASDATKPFAPPVIAPDDLAFLQYTSGTTGIPKGVMVAHAQVAQNVRRIRHVWEVEADSRVFLWLPPYHDMGLVDGLIMPLAIGARSVLMSPVSFLTRPLRWLSGVTAYRATHTIAPNFAYQMCIDTIAETDVEGLDLSSLVSAASGAEPIRIETVSAFAEKFAAAGFRHTQAAAAYGLAETVVLATAKPSVSGRELSASHPRPASTDHADGDSGERRRFAVSCGRVIDGHELKIVDPETCRECAAEAVGEIWLSGPSIASGYWKKPEETEATFHARLADDPDSGLWLRTGDLGSLIDRELYVLGRIKEMIIVRGRNLYAQDIEDAAAASDPILGHGRTIAFGIEEDGEERVVIVHGLTRSAMHALDAPSVAATMRRAVLETHEIDVAAIVFVKRGALPRTTSGKLQRGQARDLFRTGKLDVVAEWSSAGQVSEADDPETSRATADRLVAWLREVGEEHFDSRQIENDQEIPLGFVRSLADAGLFGMQLPSRYGGLGLRQTDIVRILGQLAAIDTTLALFVGVSAGLGTYPIRHFASPEVRERVLPRLARGEAFASFPLAEPAAGSNPRALEAIAEPDGPGRWRLYGEKSWSDGPRANYISIFCRLLDEDGRSLGITGFVIESTAEGVVFGDPFPKLGFRAASKCVLKLEGVPVDASSMLGGPGDGYTVLQRSLSYGRFVLAAASLGGIRRCLQIANRFANRRVVGTGLLINNQITRERITTLFAKSEGLASLLHRSAELVDRDSAAPPEVYSLLKMCAGFHWDAADFLVQLLGGRGYQENNGVAKILRDSRAGRILEGPTEIHELFVATKLLNGASDLTRFVETELHADEAAQDLDRLGGEVGSHTSQDSLAVMAGHARRLAQYALYTTLHATMAQDLRSSARPYQVTCLETLANLRDTSARAVRDGLSFQSTMSLDEISEGAESLAKSIGDVDHRYGGVADPLLWRDHGGQMTQELGAEESEDCSKRQAVEFEHVSLSSARLVRTIIGEIAGRPVWTIGPESRLQDLGLDSLQGTRLAARLAEATGRTIDLETVFEAPTVGSLAAALDDAKTDWTATNPIPRVDRSEPMSLSFQQERSWFLEKLEGYGGAFSSRNAIELVGRLDIPRIEAILSTLYRRHETLRMRVDERDGRAFQVFQSEDVFELKVTDLTGYDDPVQAGEQFVRERDPIDIAVGAFRAELLRLGEENHVLLFDVHHIAYDGASFEVIIHEFIALWRAGAGGESEPLPELPVQYVDFAAWQRAELANGSLSPGLDYWRSAFADLPKPLVLPSDRPRPARPSFRGEVLEATLSRQLVDDINTLAMTSGATLFMVLEAALAVLLSRYNGARDVVVGTVVSGRPRAELMGVVGPFFNMVALRNRVDAAMSFTAVLAELRETAISAFDHQLVPHEAVVEAVLNERNPSLIHAPLFQVLFQLHTEFGDAAVLDTLPLEGLTARVRPTKSTVARHDLTFDLFQLSDGGVGGTIEYALDLFDRESVETLWQDYVHVLEQVCEEPDQLTGDIKLRDDNLASVISLRQTTFLVCGTFMTEPFEPCLEAWCARLGLRSEILFAGYGQVLQTLLDPDSALFAIERGAALFVVRPQDWIRDLPDRLDDSELRAFMTSRAEEHADALAQASERAKVPIVLLLAPASPDCRNDLQAAEAVRLAETVLAERTESLGRVGVVVSDAIEERWPGAWGDEIHDRSADAAGHVPYTEQGYAILASEAMRAAHEGLRRPFKVIVVDCDNTLWDGVVGEVGVARLEIGAGHRALQQALIAASQAGLLICLCSKNHEDDVLSALDEHPDMALTRAHIVAHRINWDSKPDNIASLAQELSLGLDSFVFLDDNPVEIAQVRAALPEVVAVTVPPAPALAAFVQHLWPLDRSHTTHEDQGRTRMYQEEAARAEVKRDSVSYDDFLRTLALAVDVAPLAREELERAAQMTLRTNQFNASPKRLSESELAARIEDDSFVVERVRVRDRFGDYGFVGLYAGRRDEDCLTVDVFLMSCRVLGRGVETRMLNALGESAFRHGLARIAIELTTTSRNEPVRRFLDRLPAETVAISPGVVRLVLPTEVAKGFGFDSMTGEADAAAYNEARAPSASTEGRRLTAVPVVDGVVYERLAEPSAALTTLLEAAAAIEQGDRRPTARPSQYVAPRNETETIVAGMFGDLLGVERVGAEDNFFDLGGHSLLAVRLVSQLEAETGECLPLRMVFEAPTVSALAKALASDTSDTADLSAMLLKDCGLGDAVAPLPIEQFVPINKSDGVLLTGATGFLGRYLLKELLGAGVGRVWCLSRAECPKEGKRRIRRALAEISGDLSRFDDGVEVVCGDLAMPRLGLDPANFNRIVETCDTILHNGADVNFVKSYQDLRPANVLSIVELLKLAATGRRKTIRFVSTIAVFDDPAVDMDPQIRADPPIKGSGYAQSKWVGEQILLRARNRDFSVVIYRPGLIVGDSQTGWYGTDDVGTALFSILIDTGYAPEVNRTDFFPINVDRAACQIISSMSATGDNGISHVFDRAELSVADVLSAAQAADTPLRLCPPDEWQEKADALLRSNPGHESGWLIRLTKEQGLPTYDHGGVSISGDAVSPWHQKKDAAVVEQPESLHQLAESLVMPFRWLAERRKEI